MKNYREYYKQLGNLLYAMAAIDGSVAPKELQELRKMVREKLVPVEMHTDEFGTDMAYVVEFQFDLQNEQDQGSSLAWEEVEEYLHHNAPLLPEADKKRMMEAAETVAAAFHGINKEEHMLLVRLKKAMEL